MNYTSTIDNQTLMANARESLKGKWGIAMGTWVVFFILTNLGNLGSENSLSIVSLIIGGPLSLGYVSIILLISRNQEANFVLLFNGFQRFGVAFLTYLLLITSGGLLLYALLFSYPTNESFFL